MRVLFTKYQEEVTTVKKSITEIKIETGGADFKTAEFPVVEAGPGVLNVDGPAATKPVQTRTDGHGGSPIAVGNRAEQVRDIVDLQGPSKNQTPGPVGYSVRGAVRNNPYQEFRAGERLSQSGSGSVVKESQTDRPVAKNEERLSRYNLAARIFVATQTMSQYDSRKEKKLTINIEV
ncbi:hypothetical protein [Syntrophorhabdus aromaticivorans]|uniref:hypothetical protein n=1 Tax=Syntrophorhabdus aromaticivorans TaxID=328301 RepID=UPI000416FBAE|nr:hypothetical protein [Syntrophorhabdus aromaticivorans]